MSDDNSAKIIVACLLGMNLLIGDAMGMGYCSGCGDALVWPSEERSGRCYRCEDSDEDTDR